MGDPELLVEASEEADAVRLGGVEVPAGTVGSARVHCGLPKPPGRLPAGQWRHLWIWMVELVNRESLSQLVESVSHLENEDVRESAVLSVDQFLLSLACGLLQHAVPGGCAHGGDNDSVHGAANTGLGVLLLETPDPGRDRVIFLGLVLALAEESAVSTMYPCTQLYAVRFSFHLGEEIRCTGQEKEVEAGPTSWSNSGADTCGKGQRVANGSLYSAW